MSLTGNVMSFTWFLAEYSTTRCRRISADCCKHSVVYSAMFSAACIRRHSPSGVLCIRSVCSIIHSSVNASITAAWGMRAVLVYTAMLLNTAGFFLTVKVWQRSSAQHWPFRLPVLVGVTNHTCARCFYRTLAVSRIVRVVQTNNSHTRMRSAGSKI